MNASHAKTWIEISQAALLHNCRLVKREVTPSQVVPVLKANAYGHGAVLAASVLDREEAPFFAVDALDEAIELASAGVKTPLLILGHIPLASLPVAIERGFAFVLSSREAWNVVLQEAEAERYANVHIECETGLHRQGASLAFVKEIVRHPLAKQVIRGLCMHFANAEDLDPTMTSTQLERFQAFEDVLEEADLPVFKHAACSAAAFLSVASRFDAVRLGISLYGIWSAPVLAKHFHEQRSDLVLKPVITWKTMVVQVKELQPGDHVGYGMSFTAEKPMKIAVLPIGYADGFDRQLHSNRGFVLIRGERCPVIGRVCMNMTMVDVTHLAEVKIEDEVVLFGVSGNQSISPADWEALEATPYIAYEAVARLSARVPRHLVE